MGFGKREGAASARGRNLHWSRALGDTPSRVGGACVSHLALYHQNIVLPSDQQ